MRTRKRCRSGAGGGEPSIAYDYVPGAGDDEESWARGLTPELMWRHRAQLLQAGHARVLALVARLVGSAPGALSGRKARQPLPRPTPAEDSDASSSSEGEPSARAEAPALASAAPAQGGGTLRQGALLHCQLPVGCSPEVPGAARVVGRGIYLVGDTGLALGSAAAASDPGLWRHVDAVLHVGVQRPIGPSAPPAASAQPEAPSAAAASAAAIEEAAAAAIASDGLQPPPVPGRSAWLPAPSCKADRHALHRQLPGMLRFAAAHLAAGRRVLVCCDSGTDASVCAALACLLACFRLTGGAARPAAELCAEAAAAAAAGRGAPAERAGFSKLQVRRYLAALTAHYPQARPTRGSLRQVFVFFHEGPLQLEAPA